MQFSQLTLTLLLALPHALASISLGDTSPLNTNDITAGCLNTYNRAVPECTPKEISSGSCSSECSDALGSLGKDIMLACRQASAASDSLLRKILDNQLAATLCTKTAEQEQKDITSTTEVVKDEAATTTTAAPEETSIDGSSTVTSEAGKPTETDSVKTPSSSSGTSTATSSGPSVSPTKGADDTILGGGADSAAGRVGVGMGVILGAAIAGVVSML